MWPPDDELLTLWRDLLADGDSAGAFAAAVLPPLEADLARRHWADDPADLVTAAGDAVLALIKRPGAYDPGRTVPLPKFLCVIAGRDLSNLRVREARHQKGRKSWDHVELSHPAGNEGEEHESFDSFPALLAEVEALSDTDRLVFELMRDGERHTATIAAAMGLADRPPAEQFAEVQRAKGRIMARLKRAGRGA